jgi:hypothetical protein
MIIETNISWGLVELLRTFFKANELDVVCEERHQARPARNLVTLSYDDNSDTAYQITFMSVKHLGLENMLCDYLIRCGIAPSMISEGRVGVKRDMDKLERDWQERRKQLGFR